MVQNRVSDQETTGLHIGRMKYELLAVSRTAQAFEGTNMLKVRSILRFIALATGLIKGEGMARACAQLYEGHILLAPCTAMHAKDTSAKRLDLNRCKSPKKSKIVLDSTTQILRNTSRCLLKSCLTSQERGHRLWSPPTRRETRISRVQRQLDRRHNHPGHPPLTPARRWR